MNATSVAFVFLVLIGCCASIQITDPKFSFSSQLIETHLVFRVDSNRAANAGMELTVDLSGVGAPAVAPEEVLSVSNGVVEVIASNSRLSTTGLRDINSAIVNSGHAGSKSAPFLYIVLCFFGAFAGLKFRFLGILLMSLALLMGTSIALKQLDPSWKLTVTATIPSSLSLSKFYIDILRGSVTMNGGEISVSTAAYVDLCNSGNDVNFINFDGSSLALSGSGYFCATKQVILQNAIVNENATLNVESMQDSGHVFVKNSFTGNFEVSSKNGFAIATPCNNNVKQMNQTDTLFMKGTCGTKSNSKIQISGYYDGVLAVAEGVSAQLKVAKRWSDPQTWGGQIPQNGMDVVIAKDQIILLDTTTASLRNLEIRGTLIADQQKDFQVTADSIFVFGTGTLRVGTVYEPYTRKGVFTLTGAKGNYTSRAPLQGFSNSGTSRTLVAYNGGKLLLYGALPRRTYTRLNDNADVNSTLLTVDSVDGWMVGDMIAISPTTFPGTSSTDHRKIVAINQQTRQVTIDNGLSYGRWGKLQYATDNGISLTQGPFEKMKADPEIANVLDERAVIIHLTRNIVVNSANDSHWLAGHGVHVMWMGVDTQVQLSGVEVHRAGQAGVLGRYAIHAHMQSYNMNGTTSTSDVSDGVFVGDATGVFVRNCAVHNSVNRAYTIHGTCGARYENNVAYDILGHAYFFEDGSEMRNHFIGNVVLNVRAPPADKQILRHDGAATGIWLTNGYNHFRNNIVGDTRNGPGIWNTLAWRPVPEYVLESKPNSTSFESFPDRWEPKIETWTLTAINSSHWSAVGTVSGRKEDVLTNVRYQNSIIRILISGSAATGSIIKFRVTGNAGGCFGQSRMVSIIPQYMPMLDYSNNTAFAAASQGVVTDLFVINELGDVDSRAFITTSDGQPTDDHNGPTRIPTVFDRHRIWMCAGGGYANRVYNPLYKRWIVSNNAGNDLSGATQNGAIEKFLMVGHSLNNLEPRLRNKEPRHGFATYHFSLTFENLSIFNYPANSDPAAKTAYSMLEASGIIQSWDLYLGMLEDGPKKLKNWRTFNCTSFERTPPVNIEYLYPNNAGGPSAGNRHWTLSGAMFDANGVLSGVNGTYITFDHPFLAYNIPDSRRPTPSSRTIYTSQQYFGLQVRDADGQRADWAPVTFERLDAQFNPIPNGKWVVEDGATASFFPNMRHASLAKDGIFKVYNHVNPAPNYSKYSVNIYNAQNNNATFILGMPWSGSVPAEVRHWDYPFTAASSMAELKAIPQSWYQDVSADLVWYHCGFVGNMVVTLNIKPK